jgi:NADH:ubiquinone oxidoreductase subunit 4 (subunit M)
VNSLHNGRPDLKLHEQIGLGVIVVMILITGFFPQLLLNITEHFSDTVTAVFIKAKQ